MISLLQQPKTEVLTDNTILGTRHVVTSAKPRGEIIENLLWLDATTDWSEESFAICVVVTRTSITIRFHTNGDPTEALADMKKFFSTGRALA